MAYQELYNYTGKNAVKMAGQKQIPLISPQSKIKLNALFPVLKRVKIKSWRCYGMTETKTKQL